MKRTKWLLLCMAVLALAAWGCGDKEEPVASTETPAADGAEGAADAGPKVDINTATVEELDALKGVSPTVAQSIVKFRNENNGFTSVDQLNEVKGIGDSLLAKLRPLVTCGTTVAPATGAAEGEPAEGSEGAAAAGEGEIVSADGKPDFNTADAAAIKAAGGRMTMAVAESIVAAREAAGGKFTSWDEVDKIRGVGESTLAKLQDAFSLAGAASGSSSAASSSATTSHTSSSATSGGGVNLNTATLEQLDALPRVSPRVAQAIVDARNALPGKKFRTWDQVDAVPGVGETMLAKLKETCTIN